MLIGLFQLVIAVMHIYTASDSLPTGEGLFVEAHMVNSGKTLTFAEVNYRCVTRIERTIERCHA